MTNVSRFLSANQMKITSFSDCFEQLSLAQRIASVNHFRTNHTYMATVYQRHGQTDGQTDGRTDGRTDDLLYQYRPVKINEKKLKIKTD